MLSDRVYLGLGKTLFNSSACLLVPSGERPEIELVLSERVLRKKATGVWPEKAIRELESQLSGREVFIAENRDVLTPGEREKSINQVFPFYEYLEQQGLSQFSQRFNCQLEFVTHHFCHAMATVTLSPFEKCVIVVMDGAGSKAEAFCKNSEEFRIQVPASPEAHEECTVYLHNQGKLRCVYKRWQSFHRSKKSPRLSFSEGAGILYENASEFIFNSSQSAGKVMGLAPFGRARSEILSRVDYLESLNWDLAFRGKDKETWESSGNTQLYSDIAAHVQRSFEGALFPLLESVRRNYPEYRQLILTGGCALNCTANGKILNQRLFDEIYVPPFPGDESIGLGAASVLYFGRDRHPWKPLPKEQQNGYFGARSSIPKDEKIETTFRDFSVKRPVSISKTAAQALNEGKILGWFQGRSESGPRALGNRSILARPDVPGLKDRLNRQIKFREDFSALRVHSLAFVCGRLL